MYPILRAIGKSLPARVSEPPRSQLAATDIGLAFDWLESYNSFLSRKARGHSTETEFKELYASGVELPLVFSIEDRKAVQVILDELVDSIPSLLPKNPIVLGAVRGLSGLAVFFGLGSVVTFELPYLLIPALAFSALFALSTKALRISRDIEYGRSLISMLEPDSAPLPIAFEADYWGQQVLNATRVLQNREPWAIEIALWMALFSLSGHKLEKCS